MTNFRLDGKVAVVTGAAGLLGKQHCAALAEAGAVVYACDLSSKDSENVAIELGAKHHGVSLDVTSEESAQEIRNMVLANHGRIDILVNNAAKNDAVERPSDTAVGLEQYPVNLFRSVIDVNVTGVFVMCKVLGSVMAAAGSGSIINIASTYGTVAPDQSLYRNHDGVQTFIKGAAYPTSKGAVIQLTRYLASYWGKSGVRANCLSPGGVANGQAQFFVENYEQRTPLRRMANPADYRGTVVFLASDASSYMTGHNIVVDGGWTAW